MQILSLNINGFFGSFKKNSKALTNCDMANKILEKIFDKAQPEIIVLSEFDVHSSAGVYVIRCLCSEKGYYLVYPNECENISKKCTSIVLMFTKKKITSKKSSGLLLKWNEILYNDYRVIGVHIPVSVYEKDRAINYWEDVLIHYEKYKDEKVVYIGDMNVYTDGTPAKEKLNKLIEEKGAKDAWIEKKGTNYDIEKSYTFRYKTRIDYAIMSQTALENLNYIENMQEFFEEELSDHSALLIDLK